MTNERSTGTSSKLATLLKMMGLVKPLSGFMALAVVSGTLAYLAVQFIPVLGRRVRDPGRTGTGRADPVGNHLDHPATVGTAPRGAALH